MKVTVNETKNTVTIVLPIEPRQSASGKSLVIASTRGNKSAGVKYDGRDITVGVNAYTANAD